MSIKSILCITDGSKTDTAALDMALYMAQDYKAHVRFLYLSGSLDSYAPLYGDSFMAGVSVLEALEKEDQLQSQKAKQHVVSAVARHQMALDVQDITQLPSASFYAKKATLKEGIGHETLLSDLVVMSDRARRQYMMDDPTLLAVLFSTARPVLLVPAEWKPSPKQGKTLAIAWNCSKEAAQAIHAAKPFLKQAETRYILRVHDHNEQYDMEPDLMLTAYLRAHDMPATLILIDRGDRPAGEALLAKASELNADMLVTGAYGHSRLREIILGGVTRHLIHHAPLPLFMAH